MGKKYLCSGNIMLDTVIQIDGTTGGTNLGGPALFAYAGVRLWTDDCQLVVNVGSDFDTHYGQWMKNNYTADSGVNVMTEFCTHHNLTYHEDGTYDWGYANASLRDGAINMGMLEAKPYQFEAACDKGSCLYYPTGVTNMAFWHALFAAKEKKGFQYMWEIGVSPNELPDDYRDRIKWVLQRVEMFSVNFPECKILFGVETEDEAIATIKSMFDGFTILRVGKRGMYVIEGQNHWFIPSINAEHAVDSTGCGNCSTGAAMYAYNETKDPIMAGIMANISAGYNVLQYGPYPHFTQKERDDAMALAKKLREEYRG